MRFLKVHGLCLRSSRQRQVLYVSVALAHANKSGPFTMTLGSGAEDSKGNYRLGAAVGPEPGEGPVPQVNSARLFIQRLLNARH